jgi:hypothetical protein
VGHALNGYLAACKCIAGKIICVHLSNHRVAKSSNNEFHGSHSYL